MPVLRTSTYERFLCAPESFTPDVNFCLGETPEVAGLFVGAGFNSQGIIYAPGAGRALADWVVDGRAGLRRLGRGRRSLRRGAGEPPLPARAHPGEPRPALRDALAARAVPRGPGRTADAADDRLARRTVRTSATPTGGSGRSGSTGPVTRREPTYSYRRPSWFGPVAEEHRAAREAVAFFDLSSFATFDVSGPDALAVAPAPVHGGPRLGGRSGDLHPRPQRPRGDRARRHRPARGRRGVHRRRAVVLPAQGRVVAAPGHERPRVHRHRHHERHGGPARRWTVESGAPARASLPRTSPTRPCVVSPSAPWRSPRPKRRLPACPSPGAAGTRSTSAATTPSGSSRPCGRGRRPRPAPRRDGGAGLPALGGRLPASRPRHRPGDTPVSAGLDRFVRRSKDFVGKDALTSRGTRRKQVFVTLDDPEPTLWHGESVRLDDRHVGLRDERLLRPHPRRGCRVWPPSTPGWSPPGRRGADPVTLDVLGTAVPGRVSLEPLLPASG